MTEKVIGSTAFLARPRTVARGLSRRAAPRGLLLAWRTTTEGTVLSAGSVRFDPAPGDQGTEVRVHLQYAAPLGAVGAGLASLTPYNPALLLGRGLDHIKRHLELGRRAELTA